MVWTVVGAFSFVSGGGGGGTSALVLDGEHSIRNDADEDDGDLTEPRRPGKVLENSIFMARIRFCGK